MKKTVLLIFPAIFQDNKNISLPASVLYAGSFLSKEYEVKILDVRLEDNWGKKLEEMIADKLYAVGVTCLTGYQIRSAIEICKYVKSIEQDIPIIWGGVNASILPELTLKNPFVDFVVIGEGEETFDELLKNLKDKNKLYDVKGIGFKDGSKVIINSAKDCVDLNKYYMPNYDLLDVNKYIISGELIIFTSRGCPHECSYCYNQVFNKRKYRAISPENVINNIEYIVKNYPVSTINILDDNFFVNKDRVIKICELLLKKRLPEKLKFKADCRIDYFKHYSTDFLKLLEDAGFVQLYFGVESGVNRILKEIKKNITSEDVIRVNERLKGFKIIPYYSIMAGFPGESIGEAYETLRLASRLIEDNPKAKISQLVQTTPFPGTELFEIAKIHGFKPPDSLEGYSKFNYDWNFPYIDENKIKAYKKLSIIFFLLDSTSMAYSLGDGALFVILNKLISKLIRLLIKYNYISSIKIIASLVKFIGGKIRKLLKK